MNTALPCYYPGNFNPPTKYDLKITQWLCRKIHDVSEVIVVIGKSKPGEMAIEDKAAIWEEYLNDNLHAPISIKIDRDNSPLSAIHKMYESLPKDAFTIAVPEEVAKNQQFQSHFEVFPRYEIIITPNYDKTSSQQMIDAAAAGDLQKFSEFVPGELSLDIKKKIMSIVKPEEQQSTDEVLGWDKTMNELYARYGLVKP